VDDGDGSRMPADSEAWRRSERRWSWDAAGARMLSLELENCTRGDKGAELGDSVETQGVIFLLFHSPEW
jgi:hypothetical protein